MSIDISVIIPTYNRCNRLKETIDSVLNQSYQNFELLICDDGSTDGTKAMVEAIEDDRVIWISGENSGGPATPRNRGVNYSKAEWVAFLDSDDFWLPTKLEEQLAIIEKHQVKGVVTNAKIYRDEKTLDDNYFLTKDDKRLTFDDLLQVNHVICSSILIDKKILLDIGLFPEDKSFKAIEDYALWLSSSMLTDIYYMGKSLTIYRDEEADSIRGEVHENEYLKHNKIIQECYNRTKKINKSFSYKIKLLHIYLLNNIKFLIRYRRK